MIATCGFYSFIALELAARFKQIDSSSLSFFKDLDIKLDDRAYVHM